MENCCHLGQPWPGRNLKRIAASEKADLYLDAGDSEREERELPLSFGQGETRPSHNKPLPDCHCRRREDLSFSREPQSPRQGLFGAACEE